MRIKNRQQVLLIGVFLAVAVLVGDKVVWGPLKGVWQDRSKRIVELKESIEKGSLLMEREAMIRERWRAMRTNSLPASMPVAENEVFQAFDRWSRDSGISIRDYRQQWKTAGKEHSVLECRFDAFGTMQELTRFLYNVEKDPLPLKIELVDIKSSDNTGRQLNLTLQISGLLLTEVQTP